MAGDRILYLSGRDVARALEGLDPVAVVASALSGHARGEAVLPEEAHLAWANRAGEPARALSMPAVVAGCPGIKVICASSSNHARGLPRASGLMLVLDRETARPVCVMEGARISCLRTAAVTALAIDLLAAAPAERLALLGAGGIATCQLELLPPRLRDLSEIRLFDVRRERAAALADRARAAGWPVTVSSSAEEAVRGAGVVVPVTTASSGYIAFDWLQPGCLLVNVSLDDPLPEVVLRADKVFVDDWRLVAADGRRLLGRMLRQGLIAPPNGSRSGRARCIDGELGDVLLGAREGRAGGREIIVVNPFGLALEDVAVARCVYERAVALGLGTSLER